MTGERLTEEALFEALGQLEEEAENRPTVHFGEVKSMEDFEDLDLPDAVKDALRDQVREALGQSKDNDGNGLTEFGEKLGGIPWFRLEAMKTERQVAFLEGALVEIERQIRFREAEVLEEAVAAKKLGSNDTERKIRMEKILTTDPELAKLYETQVGAKQALIEAKAEADGDRRMEEAHWRAMRAYLKGLELGLKVEADPEEGDVENPTDTL